MPAGGSTPDALKVKDAANAFLNAKSEALNTGEPSPRTWVDYRAILDMMVEGWASTEPSPAWAAGTSPR
jgi:hypothetical protein